MFTGYCQTVLQDIYAKLYYRKRHEEFLCPHIYANIPDMIRSVNFWRVSAGRGRSHGRAWGGVSGRIGSGHHNPELQSGQDPPHRRWPGAFQPQLTRAGASVAGDQPETETEVSAAHRLPHQPQWMDVEKLEKIRDHEWSEETFTRMPSPYYMELIRLLLNHTSDYITSWKQMRSGAWPRTCGTLV